MNELEATRAKLKCLEMVEGTGLNWWDVVKYVGSKLNTGCDFHCKTSNYTFALGVVEGKPVWEGDTLYVDNEVKVIAKTTHLFKNNPRWSWHPPKPATLMVELPIDVVRLFSNACTLSEVDRITVDACKKALEQMK